jgi:hypothetical protein
MLGCWWAVGGGLWAVVGLLASLFLFLHFDFRISEGFPELQNIYFLFFFTLLLLLMELQ